MSQERVYLTFRNAHLLPLLVPYSIALLLSWGIAFLSGALYAIADKLDDGATKISRFYHRKLR